MYSKNKIFIAIGLLLVLVGGGVWFKVFYLGSIERDVTKENAIKVTATQLVHDFTTNEKQAYRTYTDAKDGKKAVEVTGTIQSVTYTEDSVICISFQSNNMFTDVFATLKKQERNVPKVGAECTIKGICTGMLSSVTIQDAILIK